MKSYGIRDGYTPRLTPDYFHDVRSDGKVWQPDVLPIAAYLARRFKAERLIDVGCGRGQNLVPYFGQFAITGIDYGDNITFCKNYGVGQWLMCNLESETPAIHPCELRNAVVICSDVIEHLVNPEKLMETLAYYAEHALLVILTTPDRQRVYGHDQAGPPGNPHHVREWSLPEMVEWSTGYTSKLLWAGWTMSNNVDTYRNTMLLMLSRTGLAKTLQEIETLFKVEVWHGHRG